MENIPANVKRPADHAAKAEAGGDDVLVNVDDLTIRVPRNLIDSYEATNTLYSGFTLPIIQQLGGDGEKVLEAATDDDGKISNRKVQQILVAAFTKAAQGN